MMHDAQDDSSPCGMSTVCHAARSICPHHMETILQICKVLDVLPYCIRFIDLSLIFSLGQTDGHGFRLFDSYLTNKQVYCYSGSLGTNCNVSHNILLAYYLAYLCSIQPRHWKVLVRYLNLFSL